MNELPLELDEDGLEYRDEVDYCPACDEGVVDAWFDRELCSPPCDTMHYRCPKCGTPLDHCKLDKEI